MTGKARKTTELRRLIASPELEFLCEAHIGISARIVEEAGFRGIWASGLTMAASLGVRDNNEISWTQVLEVLEHMSDASTVPILADCDTGYGNFNNLRRFVKKLECRGLAGACLEDKRFPKTNSFLHSEAQHLADPEEVCGKIRAGKDAQMDEDFVLVARTEAFIVGTGLSDGLRRAEAYRQAGADAILVHSKRATCADVEVFAKEWAGRHPLVIVPTKYYTTPTARFRELGISVVIWANHLMRAAIGAMQDAASTIHRTQSLITVEDKVVPLQEVFRLQRAKELEDAEVRYLPTRGRPWTAIILAASRGAELGLLTAERPKAMIRVGGEPILYKLVGQLRRQGVLDVVVVRGYRKETIAPELHNLTVVDNDAHATTGELHSLWRAVPHLRGECVISYGDCLYRGHHLRDLLDSAGDIRILVDCDIRRTQRVKDLVTCSQPCVHDFLTQPTATLTDIVTAVTAAGAMGEWTGLLAVSNRGAAVLRQELEVLAADAAFARLHLPDLIKAVMSRIPVSVVYTRGGWLDIDDIKDLSDAESYA